MSEILVLLETVGDPDDGMVTVKTGCISGMPPKPSLAVINEENVIKCPQCGKGAAIVGCRGCEWVNM